MNTLDEQDELTIDDRLDAQRNIIRESLNEIANDIGMAMRDVGLTFPVYMTVRNSGDALVTIATTARSIRCRLAAGIGNRLSNHRREGRLRSVTRAKLPCAIANAGAINAADVTAN